MSPKNNILSILALTLAVIALVVSLTGWLRSGENYADQIQELQERNTLLQSQLDALSAQVSIGSVTLGNGLTDWELTLVPWQNGSGASVTLTAVPGDYEAGMGASFSIRMGSTEVASVVCSWTGEAFSATAELTAQDGYSYYCILENADGSIQQLPLTTPENPVEDVPVYLATALSAYCNLTVDSWVDLNDTLTVSAAYVQVQLPRLTVTGQSPTIEKAELVLYFGGEPYSRAELALESSTGAGAYEQLVTDGVLAMPPLTEEEGIELWLEVTLSDGQVLSALGASWYQSGDELFMVVG